MKNFAYVCIIIALSGCGTPDHNVYNDIYPTPINDTCLSEGNVFDIGRYSFTIKLNPDWQYSFKPRNQEVSFHYQQDRVTSSISINSYHDRNNHFEGSWHSPELVNKKLQSFYDSYKSKRPRINPFYDLRMVQRAGMKCIREEERWSVKTFRDYNKEYVGAVEDTLTYICFISGQTNRRPINVRIHQSIMPKAVPLDLEKIVAPVFESFVLNPTPPPLSNDYWKTKLEL